MRGNQSTAMTRCFVGGRKAPWVGGQAGRQADRKGKHRVEWRRGAQIRCQAGEGVTVANSEGWELPNEWLS